MPPRAPSTIVPFAFAAVAPTPVPILTVLLTLVVVALLWINRRLCRCRSELSTKLRDPGRIQAELRQCEEQYRGLDRAMVEICAVASLQELMEIPGDVVCAQYVLSGQREEALKRAAESAETISYEARMRRWNGEEMGSVIVRVQSQEGMAASQRQLKALFDSLKDGTLFEIVFPACEN